MEPVPYCLSRVAIVAGEELDHQAAGLAPVERSLFLALPMGRRAEWAAGRRAARRALRLLTGEAAQGMAIGRAEDGAPVVVGAPGALPLVSISHGHKEAVAVAGFMRRLGVDLCELSEAGRVRRVALRFIDEPERALAESLGGDFGWAALWALKEAGAKAERMGLFAGGLRATRLSSLEPPSFCAASAAVTRLEAVLMRGVADVVAVVWSDG